MILTRGRTAVVHNSARRWSCTLCFCSSGAGQQHLTCQQEKIPAGSGTLTRGRTAVIHRSARRGSCACSATSRPAAAMAAFRTLTITSKAAASSTLQSSGCTPDTPAHQAPYLPTACFPSGMPCRHCSGNSSTSDRISLANRQEQPMMAVGECASKMARAENIRSICFIEQLYFSCRARAK